MLPANATKFVFELIGLSDELRVLKIEGEEAISTPYRFVIDIVSESFDLTSDLFLEKAGVLTLVDDGLDNRLIHGEVIQFQQQGHGDRFANYRLVLAPKCLFMVFNENYRIFQDKSVPTILKQVLGGAGISGYNVKFALSSNYPKRNYCVQYGETDLAFVERLMSEEGMFYFFDHYLDHHCMVISDKNAVFGSIQGTSSIPFHAKTGMAQPADSIYSYIHRESISNHSVMLGDYTPNNPQLALSHHANPKGELEDYRFPGNFRVPAEGKRYAQIQLEATCVNAVTGKGQTQCVRLNPGHLFDMKQHLTQSFNRKYLLTKIKHDGTQPQSLEEGASNRGTEYQATFETMPNDTPFRVPMNEKPTAYDHQTALVVGPAGEEIYTDNMGRVKVQFHWDREGQMNEKSSCWIRVAQGFAGNGYGSVVLPRIGQEVIVAFERGDPDKPVITGSAYNAANPVPESLPFNKTRTVFRSNSSPGGGGHNELRIDDKKGKEQVYLHAEKDMDLRIKNDLKQHIQKDQHHIITKQHNENIGKDKHLNVSGNSNLEVGDSLSIKVGKDLHIKSGNNHIQQAQQTHLKAATKLVVDGGMSLTVKGGGGTLFLSPAGVSITGPIVRINSGGGGGGAQSASPQAPAKPEPPVNDKPGNVAKPGSVLIGKAIKGIMNKGAGGEIIVEDRDTFSNDPNKAFASNSVVRDSSEFAPKEIKKETWIKIRAHHNDAWETPIPMENIKVFINGGAFRSGLKLHEGVGKNTYSSTLERAKEAVDEPGTLLIEQTPEGPVVVEVAREPGIEQEIESLRQSLQMQLDGGYRDTVAQMSEFQEQWDTYGYASIPMSGAQGLFAGGSSWVKDQADLFEVETWKTLGSDIADAASEALDYAAEYAEDSYESVIKSANDGADWVDENSDKLSSWNWWAEQADEAIADARDTAREYGRDVEENINDAVDFLAASTENVEKLLKHKDAILALPRDIAEGNPRKVQRFIDVVLMDIDPEMAKAIKENPDFHLVLELIADHDTALTYFAYVNLYFEAVPPNFYAYLSGKGGAYVAIEVLLLVALSFLSLGAGTAARTSMLAARLAAVAKVANNTRKLKKAQAAIAAFTKTFEEFADSAETLKKLGQKLSKARNGGKFKKGSNGTTMTMKKDSVKRDARCRICKKTTHITPRAKRGCIQYI